MHSIHDVPRKSGCRFLSICFNRNDSEVGLAGHERQKVEVVGGQGKWAVFFFSLFFLHITSRCFLRTCSINITKTRFFPFLREVTDKIQFLVNYNAFHIFLYRKFNAFYFLILNQEIFIENLIHFFIVKFNAFYP